MLYKRAARLLPRCPVLCTSIPSIDKGRHGFDGQNCFAPASDGFPRDFWLLSRRRADARQGEKDKKRRKDALAGVFALVNRW